MKHVISCTQFNRENLEEILDLAKDMKGNPKKYENAIDGKIVATLFYEPSTRTRLSFESAAQRIGGKIISTENAKEVSSAVKGETLTDTIKIIEGYADAIVIRHSDNDSSEVAASISKVPIINAGAGKAEHPTQALLDMYTIRDKKGKVDGLKVAISGDLTYGRTTHSLVKLLSLYNDIIVYGVSSEFFTLPQEYIDYMEKRNVKYIPCSEFSELPKDVDVIYHTRTQLERIEDKSIKIEELIINKKVLDTFSEGTLVMHPLPRVNEIAEDVDDDPRAVYFEQAHNGVFVRMAVLKKLLA